MAESFDDLREGFRTCTRCPLRKPATQVLGGEAPRGAPLMIVGEQPGEREDLEGRPFVGRSSRLLHRLAAEAGLDRGVAYVPRAIRHFKFSPRGKRRLHEPRNRARIETCRSWLEMELPLVRSRLILAIGAAAVDGLTGRRAGIMKGCDTVQETRFGSVFGALHPSYLLRLRDCERKAAETARFRDDLGAVAERLRTL